MPSCPVVKDNLTACPSELPIYNRASRNVHGRSTRLKDVRSKDLPCYIVFNREKLETTHMITSRWLVKQSKLLLSCGVLCGHSSTERALVHSGEGSLTQCQVKKAS